MNSGPVKNLSVSVSGIFLLDKPLGLTSNGALQRVKKMFLAKKAGHTGSLDPLATGMLPICFGEATKMSQFLLDSEKIYRGTAVLGIKTTTADAEGEVISQNEVPAFSSKQLTQVLDQFIGNIQQLPPMHSAIKHQGQPLYRLARQGVTVKREPREVNIYSFKLLSQTVNTFDFEVHCSKGTYIRTLIEDVGEMLNCGAYLGALRRTAVLPYCDFPMTTLEQLEAIQKEKGSIALHKFLLPIETCVKHLNSIELSASAAFYIRTGQSIRVPNLPSSGCVKLFTEAGEFLGIGEITLDGRVSPKRLIRCLTAKQFPSKVA